MSTPPEQTVATPEAAAPKAVTAPSTGGTAIGRIEPVKVAAASVENRPPDNRLTDGKPVESGGYRRVRPSIAIEFQPDAVEVEEAPPPRLALYTLYALLSCLIVGLLWASFAEIDRVVAARGKIVSSASHIVLQPLETSLIREFSIKAGDVVHKGQRLVTLDATFTAADLADLESKKRSYDAEIARLEAELAGNVYTLEQNPSPDDELQLDLYRRRRASYQAQVDSYQEEIGRGKAQLASATSDIKALVERLKVANEIETMRQTLQKQEVGSKLNLLIAISDRLSIGRDLSRARNLEVEADHTVRSAEAKLNAFIESWRQDIAVKLVTTKRDANQVNEQLNKARLREQRVTLFAPEDAIVLSTLQRSTGSVVQQGEVLATLVPLNAPVEAEVQISPSDIGFLALDAPVRIKLDAYPYVKHGTVEGTVAALGNDTTRDQTQSNAQPHYLGRVRILKTDLIKTPENFRLIPGMTLTGEILIGKRTVLTYLLYPLIGTLDTGLRDSSM